ncbi:YchJ family protein [Acinetobacter haemolyticus]|uniref:YchJ family protein n=1 Tax=Acinetobacter haemolyticus TaxID=29430 RepID=UPI0009492EFE|nr:YchJ family protein [Acinetobacter haemolyticus]APR71655.1 SEC-C motif-containing protein [Acinetobacter haemolyticus]MCU4379777.1 YchJ family protein [Acinetobacter haemolyticus]NAR19426.1 YchJ family protein [Acinetobacter haemolyticus]NAR30777.1 YchJ family protein [Acinetobacter haemolyticus]NAR37273.1 YchJ family protein [Acinetobacter haemolyticus]
MTASQNCPCGQGQYAECCQPLHLKQRVAENAEQLMRSRYSAFALQQIDYILETTALGQQALLDREAIADWSQSNQWLKLEVLRHQPKLDKTHALVEFKAYYCDKNQDGKQPHIHHEVSHFVLYQQRWYFLDPTLDMQITMKQACICGSGKKFKQCCAQFI